MDPGERVLLLGASGAGKSTLLHALAGVLGGDEEGEATGRLAVDGLAPDVARGRVGLVLQDPDSQAVLARVGDDVAFGCENLGVPRDEIWRRVRESLDAVGLRVPLDHPTGSLSGGQKQRLALAGVLAMKPGLLLLDEPTANLDPAGVSEVTDAVARVVADRSTTLIVVEHRVDLWWRLVDRVVVLTPSGILADGSPDAVLRDSGAALAASGVWIPGFEPEIARRDRIGGSPLLTGRELGIGRPGRISARAGGTRGGRMGTGRGERRAGARAGVRAGAGARAGAELHTGLSVTVAAGRCLAISGPNGAGKSTLGLTLAGLIPPTSGRVDASPLAGGLSSSPIDWRSSDLVTRIGTVFQDPEHQFVAASVLEELTVGARATGMPHPESEARIDGLLARLRLDTLREANPYTLSGGEKRRLSVATVLVTRPRMLVLDEPTFGQDSRTWQEIVELLAQLMEDGTGIVAVTHDRHLIETLADEECLVPQHARAHA